MTAPDSFVASITVAALLAIGFGALLLKFGRWPKRIGTTPHCPKCDYILTGNDSGTCPECGTAFTASTIVHGERRPRIGRAVFGAVLALVGLLIGGIAASGILGQIEWYHYRPFSWVMSDLDSTLPGVSNGAWAELQRRSSTGSLSAGHETLFVDRAIRDLGSTNWTVSSRATAEVESRLASNKLSSAQQNDLVECALREQTAAVRMPYTATLIDFLGQRYADHQLTAEQQKRCLDSCTAMLLKTRPQVGPRDDVPYVIQKLGRGPSQWRMSIEYSSVRVDQRTMRNQGGSTSGSIGGGSFGSKFPPQPPGHHRVRVKLNVKLGLAHGNDSADPPPFHCEEREYTADFDVLPEAPLIKLVSSPAASIMATGATAYGFRLTRGPHPEIYGMIELQELPVNVAFDVFARLNGKEYPCGEIASISGRQCVFGVFCEKLPPAPISKIDLILRSSKAAAKGTLDLTEIWDGEVTIKDVAVQEVKQ